MFVTWLWAHYLSLILNEFYMIIEEWNKKKEIIMEEIGFFIFSIVDLFIYLSRFWFLVRFFLALSLCTLAKPVQFVQVHLNVMYFSRCIYLSLIRSL